jgi:hypothetical protein
MSCARVMRSGVTVLAMFALGSATALEAAAQASNSDRMRTPPASQPERGSGAPQPSPGGGSGNTGLGSQGDTGQTGQSTGQDEADPGSSPSGSRGGASNVPNCAQMPPNAAECPQSSGSGSGR